MSRVRIRALLFLLALGSAGDLLAAITCKMTESAADCMTRANQESEAARTEAQEDTAETVVEDEAEELKDKPTGVETGGANLMSNTTDFLPLLALSGLLGDVQEGDTQGTYALDLNFLIPGLARDKNSKLQAVVNSQPVVSEGLKSQLPEEERDDLAAKLAEGLSDLSDYSVSFTFNWTDDRHGRGFNQYRDRIASLFSAVPLAQPTESALSKVGAVVARLQDPDEPDLLTTPFVDLGENAAVVKPLVEEAIAQDLDLLTQDRKLVADSGLLHLAELIDNQPQLTFTAVKRFRDPVVGGDEMSFKLTYEWGFANFNRALSRDCHRQLDTPASVDNATRSSCLGTLTQFVTAHEEDLKDGQRLSFSAEYVDIEAERFDLPNLNLTGLTIDSARKVVVLAGWSRRFAAGGTGDQPMRLDFVGRYEDVSDDPLRRDRGVATLTVTRQFGDMAVPFGIVYANHGQYLGEVDEQLSAHLGIKFDLEGGGD
jgi:hypothetical protein